MKRPISVTIIGFLFIIAGTIGIVYHATEVQKISDQPELIWIFVLRLLAIIGGIFSLRGKGWARWLMLAWMAYHTVLSFFHAPLELAVHVLFLVAAIYALFNSSASVYFQKQ